MSRASLRGKVSLICILPGQIYPHSTGSLSQQARRHIHPRSTKRLFSSSRTNHSNRNVQFQSANRLDGRTCMITGGTSGIGFAIAERFLQEGASSIVLVGRSQTRLQEAATRLASLTGTSADLDESNGTVATRAPEEDIQQSTPEKIRLLVGDVSDAGSCMREL